MSNAYLDMLDRQRSADTIIHAARKTRIYVEDGTQFRITATAKLYSLGGQAPYFSCTADIDEKRKNNRWVDYSGGCLHEETVRHFPKFAPVVHVHLSDEHGRPMHAVANALYWAGMSGMSPRESYDRYPIETDELDGKEWAPTMLANHLRVPEDEARHIRRQIALVRLNTWNPVIGTKRRYEPEMGVILAEHVLPARWQDEADAAVAAIIEANPPAVP